MTWLDLIPAAEKQTAIDLCTKAAQERAAGKAIYPHQENIFFALNATPPENLKIVVCGQDPYTHPGQAHGLAFSVREGCKLPPSLRNIFKELHDDLGCEIPASGDLTHWAEQGVLLLNAVLTVEDGKPKSHDNWGWQAVTQAVLSATRQLPQPICFILWGSSAQEAAHLADVANTSHPRLILQGPHPSPLSAYRGFFGSKPFSKANHFLAANASAPIDWTL